MEIYKLIFDIFIIGLKLEISNDFEIAENTIIVTFADGTKAKIFLKIDIINLFLEHIQKHKQFAKDTM